MAVIGDAMLDVYVQCEVVGPSPEDELAHKVKPVKTTSSMGGAANVAANLRAMGADVTLFAVVGEDDETIRQEFGDSMYVLPGRRTTVKKRIVTKSGRHIVRIDEETTENIPPDLADAVLHMIRNGGFDGTVVSDYAKGMVTDRLLDGLPPGYVADPKGRNMSRYADAHTITPNATEYAQASSLPDCHVVVTCASEGAILHGHGTERRIPQPNPRSFGDPTGCGDSFLAGLAIGLVSGLTIEESITVGNAAGALAYESSGTTAITMHQVLKELSRTSPS